MLKKKIFNSSKISYQQLERSLFLSNFSSLKLVKKLYFTKYLKSILPLFYTIIEFPTSIVNINKASCVNKFNSDFRFFYIINKKIYFVPTTKNHV